ncbi:MAG: type VI secretion system baseplate subunit TssE, partial [Acidobacteria bacterium]
SKLTKALENAVRLFEPRLSNLKVKLEPFSEVDKVLRFRLEALLKVEPTPEPIAFDTVLQPGNGEFEIKES